METLEPHKAGTLFKPGTRVKVEIHITDPPVVLFTSVRDCDISMIELDAPLLKGTRMGVLPETQVTVTETSPNGLFLAITEVAQVKTKPLPVWILRMPEMENIRHIQRRREERYEVDLHLRWKLRDETTWLEHPLLHMVNINTFGAFITVDAELEIGDELIIDLTPLIQIGGNPLANYRVTPRCKIVRWAAGPSPCYGVVFENLNRFEKGFLKEGVRRLKSKMV